MRSNIQISDLDKYFFLPEQPFKGGSVWRIEQFFQNSPAFQRWNLPVLAMYVYSIPGTITAEVLLMVNPGPAEPRHALPLQTM